MGVYDTRPPRPNSIELNRSYHSEQIDGSTYEQLPPQMGNQYAATFGNGMGGPQQMHMQHQQIYDAGLYQSHALYGQTGQGVMSPEPIYGPGTPSRNKPRPSQPPPAPPSNGSGGGTPTPFCWPGCISPLANDLGRIWCGRSVCWLPLPIPSSTGGGGGGGGGAALGGDILGECCKGFPLVMYN